MCYSTGMRHRHAGTKKHSQKDHKASEGESSFDKTIVVSSSEIEDNLSKSTKWLTQILPAFGALVVAGLGIYFLSGSFADTNSPGTPVGNPTYINANQILP